MRLLSPPEWRLVIHDDQKLTVGQSKGQETGTADDMAPLVYRERRIAIEEAGLVRGIVTGTERARGR